MFHQLARFYDDLLAGKDYAAESARLEAIARRYGRCGGKTWLDVACGTGRHLEHLRLHHDVVGVDASAPMLRLARRRLPGVPLVRGDMRSFRLGRTFDVVSCLFSAVAHLATEQDLERTFANFERHLAPGGLAIVEPWIDPAQFRPGFIHLLAHEGPGRTVVRLDHAARRGNRSVLRCHYLVAEADSGIQHWQETDLGLLVPRPRLEAILRRTGLLPRFLDKGLRPGRGLLLGQKPPRVPSRSSR